VAPVPPIDVEKPGTYKIQAFHDDYSPWEQDVEVPTGAAVRVRVDAEVLTDLEAQAVSRTRWGWGAVGVGVLSGAAAGLFWGLASSAQQQYDDADFRGMPLTAQQPYTDAILTRTVAAGSFAAVAVVATATGAVLLLHNPARDRLDAAEQSSGALTLLPVDGGGLASLAFTF